MKKLKLCEIKSPALDYTTAREQYEWNLMTDFLWFPKTMSLLLYHTPSQSSSKK